MRIRKRRERTSENSRVISHSFSSSSHTPAGGPRRSPLSECMLHDSGDPALATSTRLLCRNNHTHTKRRCRYLVFQDKFLRHVLEVSLTHFFKSVADVLLDKFVFCAHSK